MVDSIRAETISVAGHDGDVIEAYVAQPLGDDGPYGAVVVIHHLPGYDGPSKEIVRRFAHHRYLAICPNLYSREAPGAEPAEAMAVAVAAGGVPDDRLVGDVRGAADHLLALPESNGKVATIGYCSGGRQSFLAACSTELDAAIDCYGAFVVRTPPPSVPLDIKPIVDLAPSLGCPLLGLFGREDTMPAPDEVAEFEAALTAAGKTFEFHTYENAGHAFFAVDRPNYRPEAATAGWADIWPFLARHVR